MKKRICKQCHASQPLSEYYPHPNGKDGRIAICRSCSMSNYLLAAAAKKHPINKHNWKIVKKWLKKQVIPCVIHTVEVNEILKLKPRSVATCLAWALVQGLIKGKKHVISGRTMWEINEVVK